MLKTTGEQRRRRPSGRCVRAERSPSLCRKRLDPAQHRRKEEARSRRPAAMCRVDEYGAHRQSGEVLPRSQRLANSVVGAQVAGAYVRIECRRRAESGSTVLSVGGRKNRRVGVQSRDAKSVNAKLIGAAKRHCHAHHDWRTTSWLSTRRVRTCDKQPIVVQKVTSPRSASAEGRSAKPTSSRSAQSR